jgi:hypothetical protein
MIAVRLMGGLGNQMFQYALARKLAHDRRTTAYIDLQFYENQAAVDTPREYELGCFKLKPRILKPTKRPIEPEVLYIGKRGKLRRVAHQLQKRAWKVYHEPHHEFDKSVLSAPNGTYLIGYWQSEKYFSDIRPLLLKDFMLSTPASGKNAQLLEQIQSCEAVSIHVRRGDYVTNKNASEFHGTKGQEYYDKALSVITKICKKPVLFVFSDDPEWCKENLKFTYRTVYVSGNEKGFEDMRLMSHCRHNIIANSSFSWWAAWLNEHNDKIVVAPKQWFNEPGINTDDVLPTSWHAV